MKKILFALTLLLIFALNCFGQNNCQRYIDAGGSFSICTPDGWTLTVREGQKYKLMFGPSGDTFTPNINFKDEENPKKLADYVAASKSYILEHYQEMGATSVRLVDQSDFTTTSGLSGIRISLSTVFKGRIIRSLQYYFDFKPGQKFIVTCSALEGDREILDKVFCER